MPALHAPYHLSHVNACLERLPYAHASIQRDSKSCTALITSSVARRKNSLS